AEYEATVLVQVALGSTLIGMATWICLSATMPNGRRQVTNLAPMIESIKATAVPPITLRIVLSYFGTSETVLLRMCPSKPGSTARIAKLLGWSFWTTIGMVGRISLSP